MHKIPKVSKPQTKITFVKERLENITTTHKKRLSDHHKPKFIIVINTKNTIPSFYLTPKVGKLELRKAPKKSFNLSRRDIVPDTLQSCERL